MKKIITILMLQAVVLTLSAQDDDVKTLFSKNSEIRGFGAFDMKLTDFNDEKALFVGGHGGVILNKHFIFGGGGYGLTTKNDFEIADETGATQELSLYGGYGGIMLGYIIAPKEVIHVSIPVLIGAGGLEVTDDSHPVVDDQRATIERSAFFVVEPGLEVEMNVARFLRIALVGGYRFIQGVDLDLDVNDISNEDLSNWTAGISFKVGKF